MNTLLQYLHHIKDKLASVLSLRMLLVGLALVSLLVVVGVPLLYSYYRRRLKLRAQQRALRHLQAEIKANALLPPPVQPVTVPEGMLDDAALDSGAEQTILKRKRVKRWR